jgi:NTP pyrophosphatase (non-canonical NTP hydrolase)
MEIKEAQKQCSELLADINNKHNVKHEPDSMFLSLAEEVGEVARELSKKQKNYRGNFNKEELADELADVIGRTLIIAEDNNINMDKAFQNKLIKIKERFKLNNK